MLRSIPFNRSFVDSRVLPFLQEAVLSGKMSGDGPICQMVERQIVDSIKVRHVLLVTSCTHALEMGMMLLNLKPGDEVILPSFTFVSTANAVIRGGGKPVFCEISDQTMTMDVADVERRITKRTRAIIPVHYAGISAEMNELMDLAKIHGLHVLEDAAQGVNAKYRGRYLGTIGDAGAYSFHDTKNYVSGEGGAFVTNDDELALRAEIVREKGTNRANFLRGEVDRYTWVEHGSSYVLSDLLAAVLKYQLGLRDEIQERRKRIHDLYVDGLRDLEVAGKLQLPIIPDYCESNYHIFYIMLATEAERDRVMKRLKEFGIGSTFHYVPLHSSPYATRMLGTAELHLPVTDRVFRTLLRLPIYPNLEDDDVQYVVERLREILK